MLCLKSNKIQIDKRNIDNIQRNAIFWKNFNYIYEICKYNDKIYSCIFNIKKVSEDLKILGGLVL